MRILLSVLLALVTVTTHAELDDTGEVRVPLPLYNHLIVDDLQLLLLNPMDEDQSNQSYYHLPNQPSSKHLIPQDQ